MSERKSHTHKRSVSSQEAPRRKTLKEDKKKEKDEKPLQNKDKKPKGVGVSAIRKELSKMSREEKLASLSELKEMIAQEISSLDDLEGEPGTNVPQINVTSDDASARKGTLKKNQRVNSVDRHTVKKKKKGKEDTIKNKRKKTVGGSRSDPEVADERKAEAHSHHKKWGWGFHWGGHHDDHNNHSNDHSNENSSGENSQHSDNEQDPANSDSGDEGDDGYLDLVDFSRRSLSSSSNIFDITPASDVRFPNHTQFQLTVHCS